MSNTTKDNLQRYIDVNGIKTIDDIEKHKGYHLYEGLLKKYKAENPNGDISDFFPSTPTTPKVINYDADGAIAAAYQAQLDSLKRTKEYTEELVAAAKEEAIRNAYAQYDKGKATYGRNAEQLAQMGLSNSGYGDYVEGKAYGAMVGGITDANVSADKAIRDAYYNYEQGKSKATADYNASLEAAKKAYNDKYIGLLTAVEKGEIDAETANKIAKAYNLDETHISEIATIADNYGTEKKEKAILYLNDAVKNGVADKDGNITYLTEEQIKNYGAENELSEEEIAAYISQNKENTDKATVENYKQQITADTTYSDVDKLDVDDTIKTELKAYIDEKVHEKYANEFKTEIDSGEVTLGNITAIDDLYANEQISKNMYQEIYFDKALSFAHGIENMEEYKEAIKQVDGYVNQGKMTSDNAKKVKQYIAKNFATLIPESVCKVENGSFVIDGNIYPIANVSKPDGIKDQTIKDIVDGCTGEGNPGLVVIGNEVYLKSEYGNSGNSYIYIKIRDRKTAGGNPHDLIVNSIATNKNTVVKPTYTSIKE